MVGLLSKSIQTFLELTSKNLELTTKNPEIFKAICTIYFEISKINFCYDLY